jgi:serine/threonine protein kinase/Flp pilus assembly protein TadD
MNASASLGSRSGSIDAVLAEIVEEVTNKLRVGEPVDIEAYVGAHPELAERLRRLLPALAVLADLGRSAAAGEAVVVSPAPAPTAELAVLGDFRIVGEIGRGGMGVVYEAVQLSLGRRVALKVLPFAAALDPRQLQRFKTEAQAAAQLHHTNIVPVHAVGCERGVHYYAMQRIDGQNLAAVIRELRRQAGHAEDDEPPPPQAPVRPLAETVVLAGLSTEGSRWSPAYFRAVAHLGVQAAEALEHAHDEGVIHRDIKPANLLVDVKGKLWITDFGLAHCRASAGLTMTGDVVGTLRYMSPEQALGKRLLVDHRTDIYSLGVTLYELLTLAPAFPGNDREEVLCQIASEEPRPPRRINKAIAAELETIVLKAIAKNPDERYATAQELADDLRRFLEDKPIRARRPSRLQRLRKWTRRHRPAVSSAAVVLLVAALLGGGAGLWLAQMRAAAAAEARAALDEAGRLQQEEKWPEALSAVRRAKGVLAGVGADSGLCQQAEDLAQDLEMARRLEEAQLQMTAVEDGHFNLEASLAPYADAFWWYGLDVEGLEPQEAGARIRSRTIRVRLAAALLEWARLRNREAQRLGRNGDMVGKHLLAIARAADPDPWRDQLRDALERRDREALEKLAASEQATKLPPLTLFLLAVALEDAGAGNEAAVLLRQAQRQHPGHFWINHELAEVLGALKPAQWEDAIRFYTAALALRPQSPGVHLNLSKAFYHKQMWDDAIAAAQQAIALKPDYAEAYSDLGSGLIGKGAFDRAIAALQEAIRLKPNLAEAHCNMGIALRFKGDLDGALASCNKALSLRRHYLIYLNLGMTLAMKGDFDGAIAAYREVNRLEPDESAAYLGLGNALQKKGDPDGAMDAYREAVRLKEDFAEAHCNLGQMLGNQGRFVEALPALKRGHALGSRDPHWPYPSAQWVQKCERYVQLDAKLAAIVRGREQPADGVERVALAELCKMPFKKCYATAARFYGEAFAAEPKRIGNGPSEVRYNAACAAALAGCGQGADADTLDNTARARLRQQALDWLRAELAAWHKALEGDRSKAAAAVQKQMQHWLQDADFAGVRARKPWPRCRRPNVPRGGTCGPRSKSCSSRPGERPPAQRSKRITRRYGRRLVCSRRQPKSSLPRRPLGAPRKERSRRRVARDPRQAVEVGVVAGQLGQAMRLHQGHHQGVIGQQACLPADGRGGYNQGGVNGKDMDERAADACNRGLAVRKGLDDVRVLFQALKQFSRGPRVVGPGLDGHQAVGNFGEDCCGRVARDLLILDALEQLAARTAPVGVGSEVVNERVRVDENGVAGNEVKECHGSSSSGRYSNSGSRA